MSGMTAMVNHAIPAFFLETFMNERALAGCPVEVREAGEEAFDKRITPILAARRVGSRDTQQRAASLRTRKIVCICLRMSKTRKG